MSKKFNYVLWFKILIPCLGLNCNIFEVHAFALIQELFVAHANYIPFCLFECQTWPLLKYFDSQFVSRVLFITLPVTCYRTYHFHQNRRCQRTSWCFQLTRIAKTTRSLSVAVQVSSLLTKTFFLLFYFLSDQNCDWHFLVWYSNHSE